MDIESEIVALDFSLSQDFNKSQIEKKIVDLTPLKIKHLLTQNKSPAFILNNCFSPEECYSLISAAESGHFTKASVNFGGVESVNQDVRSCSRFLVDDSNFVSVLWDRISSFIPQTLKGAKVAGLNERLRFLRYHPGGLFAPHYDGTYSREDSLEVSLMTLQIYLNEDFEGGETNFLGDDDPEADESKIDRISVVPRRGMILAFEQDLMHEGAVLKSGVKYTLRTDVMYSYGQR